MYKHGSSPERGSSRYSGSKHAVEPWSSEKSGEWFKQVRQIQVINPPRPHSSNLFHDEVSLGGGAFGRRRSDITLREIGVILGGISFGALISIAIVVLYRWLN